MLNDVLVFQRFEKEQSTQLTSLWDEYLRLPSRFLKLKNQEYYLPVENRVTFVTKCVRFCTSMLVYGFSIIIMISPTASRSLLRRCFCLNIWHFSKICQFWQTKLKNPKKCCMIRDGEPWFGIVSVPAESTRAAATSSMWRGFLRGLSNVLGGVASMFATLSASIGGRRGSRVDLILDKFDNCLLTFDICSSICKHVDFVQTWIV